MRALLRHAQNLDAPPSDQGPSAGRPRKNPRTGKDSRKLGLQRHRPVLQRVRQRRRPRQGELRQEVDGSQGLPVRRPDDTVQAEHQAAELHPSHEPSGVSAQREVLHQEGGDHRSSRHGRAEERVRDLPQAAADAGDVVRQERRGEEFVDGRFGYVE